MGLYSGVVTRGAVKVIASIEDPQVKDCLGHVAALDISVPSVGFGHIAAIE